MNTNFSPFPSITTARLSLRQLSDEDTQEIFSIRSDENIAKYLDRPKANSADDARAFIDKINAGIPKGEWVYWAIIPKDKSKLIGTICLWKISEEYSKAEIGFELLPQFQGKGFMQEALTAVLDFGFNVMNLKSIEGEVDPNNDRSIKILEKNKFVKIINLGENIDQDGTVLNTVVYSLSNKS